MKLGLISDVHGNWEALQVALDRLSNEQKVDKLLFCGDLVGYGPEPNKCVSKLNSASVICIKGNHDAGLVGELPVDFFNQLGLAGIKWTKKEITAENKGYLKELSTKKYLPEEKISMVHGSSVSPLTQYITQKVEAFRSFQRDKNDFSLQIFGHTHLPVVYEIANEDVKENKVQGGESFKLDSDRRYLINPGSVGQPRDGNWKTSFAMLELND
ncbi:metallophosphoesterase family protein, partial [Candidatus Bipolaricaulota bacterium]|nr:metallophosphoesterase family protein [Candidatus Bipolaricaulota bacterium]